MWIGEFSKVAGLNVATIRFYVRSGLLRPRPGSAGGSRPYMEFSQNDLRTLNAIRAGQTMGMSLAEIKRLASERRAGGKHRMLQALIAQRDKLQEQANDLEALRQFVDAKISWLRSGAVGSPPELAMTRSMLTDSKQMDVGARR
jgi:DNA-binding transcriptional MerR regulator